jgi:hypothetical protein
MLIEEFAKQYSALKDNVPNSAEEEIVSAAKKLLMNFRYAGRRLIQPQDRDQLSTYCRNIGDIIYEISGEYPAVRIYPLEIEEAFKAAKEIKDPKEKQEALLSIMPNEASEKDLKYSPRRLKQLV